MYIDISNIRTLIQVRVSTQDPKPKKNMERSTRAIPLYHIVILCLSQPRNVRRLPGPPVYTFFWEVANHLSWGAPKHTALMTYLYMLVSSHFVSFFSGSLGNRTSPPYPIDTCTHHIRYMCPGSSSGLMTLNGRDGVPWPCHQPWYIYCHFLPIESMITLACSASNLGSPRSLVVGR